MSTLNRNNIVVNESTVILAIETSCDETAASIVMGGNDILSSVVSTQIDLHAQYGGVVPEIAGRAHLDLLNPVIAQAIAEAGISETRINAVAATHGPGLIGALLIGVSAAKALAYTWDVPYIGVNHLEAHLYAGLLEDPTLELPLVVLLVSGGHMMLIEMHQGKFDRFDEHFKGYSDHLRAERREELLKEDFRAVRPVVEQVVVSQVKEKFGGLRFYYDGGNDNIRGMVGMAESLSAITCEQCGAPGDQRHDGWIRTLCNEHATNRT
jgi:hypothetical protein